MSKNTLRQFQNIDNASMAADVTSAITNVQRLDNIGIQLVFTGTPVGTFDVQISANHAQDENGNVTTAGNWVSLTLSPTPVASGSGDTIYIDITQTSAPWIRVVYARTSGTGTLNGYITAKEI